MSDCKGLCVNAVMELLHKDGKCLKKGLGKAKRAIRGRANRLSWFKLLIRSVKLKR